MLGFGLRPYGRRHSRADMLAEGAFLPARIRLHCFSCGHAEGDILRHAELSVGFVHHSGRVRSISPTFHQPDVEHGLTPKEFVHRFSYAFNLVLLRRGPGPGAGGFAENFGMAFVEVYAMMLGGFDLDDFRDAPHVVVAVPLFVIFMMGVMIIMLNAVIAIMVSGLNAPVSSIQDASTLGFLGKESHEYGKIRFWGAIGWGLGSLMGGSIAQFFGMQYAFRLFGVGTVANAAIVLSLDFTTIQKAEESSAAGSAGGGGSSSDSVPFHHSIRRLVPTWSYALCLFVAVVAGFGGSSLQSLLLIFLSDLGAPDFLEGLALSVATISELPVFWASGYVIKRYGASSLLCASLLALTIRSILVSFLTNPWMVLPLQLLHGFTFAGTWTAGVALAKENSPVGLETSGQSVFSLSFNGIGGLSGAIVGGQLYDLVGARTMYRIKAMIFAATAILYALTLTKPKCCVK